MSTNFSYFSNDPFTSFYKTPQDSKAFQTPILDPNESSVVAKTHFSKNHSLNFLCSNEEVCEKNSTEELSKLEKEHTKKIKTSKKSEKLKEHPFLKEIKHIKTELSTPNQFWTNKKGSKKEYCKKFLNRSYERFTLIDMKKGKQNSSPELDKNDSSILAALFPLIQQLIESNDPSSRLICLNLLSLYFCAEHRLKDDEAAKLFGRYLNQSGLEEGTPKQKEEEKNVAEKIEEKVFICSTPLRIDYATIGQKFLFTDFFKSVKYLIKHIEVFKDSPSNFKQYESRLLSFLEDCQCDQFAALMNLLENAPENFKVIFDKKGDRLFCKIFEKYFSHPWLQFEEKIKLISNILVDQDLKNIVDQYLMCFQNDYANSLIAPREIKREALMSLHESVSSFSAPFPSTHLLIIQEIIGFELMKYDPEKGIDHFINLMKISKKISPFFLISNEHLEDWLLTCSDEDFISFIDRFSSLSIDFKNRKETKLIDLFNSIHQRFLKLKLISFEDEIHVITFLYSVSPIFKFPPQSSTDKMLELIELHRQISPNSSKFLNPLLPLSENKELAQDFKIYISHTLFLNIIKIIDPVNIENKSEILMKLANIYRYFKDEEEAFFNLDGFIPLFFGHFYFENFPQKNPEVHKLFMNIVSLDSKPLEQILTDGNCFQFLKQAILDIITRYFDHLIIDEKEVRFTKKILSNTLRSLSNYTFKLFNQSPYEQRMFLEKILNILTSKVILVAPIATYFANLFFVLKEMRAYEGEDRMDWRHYYLLNGLRATPSLNDSVKNLQYTVIEEIIDEKSKSNVVEEINFGFNLLEGKAEAEYKEHIPQLFNLYKKLFNSLKCLQNKRDAMILTSLWISKQKEKTKSGDSIFNLKIKEDLKDAYIDFITSFFHTYTSVYEQGKAFENQNYLPNIKKLHNFLNETRDGKLSEYQEFMTCFFLDIEFE